MPTPREIGNANLKPYKKGQSGNPSGRPKQLLSDELRKLLKHRFTATCLDPEPTDSIAKALAKEAIRQATKGSLGAFHEIGDRVEGKPDQRVELSGQGGGPIEVDVNKITIEFIGGGTPPTSGGV